MTFCVRECKDTYIAACELADRLTAVGGAVCRATIGHSFEGRAIELLSIGDGPIRLLLIAFPHGNEPSGGLTTERLFLNLLSGGGVFDIMSLHVVTVATPDTAAGNRLPLTEPHDFQAWYSASWELSIDKQVEFAFRLDNGTWMRPESQAVARAVAMVRPHIAAVLHDEPTISPAYIYLHSQWPSLAEILGRKISVSGFPILEFPYVQGTQRLATGVFGLVQAQQVGLPMGRASCAQYIASLGTPVVVTCELPLFAPPMQPGLACIADARELETVVRQCIGERLPWLKSMEDQIITNGCLNPVRRHACTLARQLRYGYEIGPFVNEERPSCSADHYRALRILGLLAWAILGLSAPCAERWAELREACIANVYEYGPPVATSPSTMASIWIDMLKAIVDYVATVRFEGHLWRDTV